MTDTTPNIDRRTVLKTATGAGAAALAGGGAFFALTGGAAASATLGVSIGDTTYSGDQGDLDWLGVDVAKTIVWDGFDVPLRYIGFKHEVNVDANSDGWHVLYDAMSARLTEWSSDGDGSDGWGGPGEYVASHGGDKADYLKGEAHADVHWAVISDGSHPSEWDSVQNDVDWTADLEEPDDGDTNTTTVSWRTTLTFYTEDGDGNAVQITSDDGIAEVTGTDTFTVDVMNEGGDTSGSTEDGTSTTG